MPSLSYLIIACLLVFTSCKTSLCGTVKNTPSRYVELKNGSILHAPNIDYSLNIHRTDHPGIVRYYSESYSPRLIAGDSMYKFSDVKSFSLGDRSYVNLGKEKFVIKCGDGKINLFARVYASPGAKSSLLLSVKTLELTKDFGGCGEKCPTRIRIGTVKGQPQCAQARFYIQNGDSGAIVPFRYRTLQTMIPPDTHPYHFLVKYNRIKTITPITMAIGMTLMIAGISYTASAKGSTPFDSHLLAIGTITGYSGFGISIASLAIFCKKGKELRNALYARNNGE